MKKPSKNNHLFLLVSLLITATFFLMPAYAQDNKNGEIDKIFSWSKPNEPGCAVAVAQNGKQIFNRAYGAADLERNVPLGTNSIFDAGSVQKQFVAASVLILAEGGKLSLDEDIHKYIPELPDYGQKITLNHLLTHTSGIRDWTGLGPLTGRMVDALSLTLRQHGLDFAPGEEFSYSNSGFVLLKEIVARTSGMTIDDFMQKRLFEPLGMKNTAYVSDLYKVVKNRALAYEKQKDGLKLDVGLGNDRGGGGGMLSTPSDLLIWNEALTSSRLGKFVTQKLHENAKLNNGRTLGYGRGLFLDTYRGGKMVSHSGGSAGYSTWLGRLPDRGLSVAVMCNIEPISATAFAHRIFDLYVPKPVDEQIDTEGPPPVIPEGIDVSDKTGLFITEQTGDIIRLSVDRGRFRVTGAPGLVTVSKDRFKRWGSSLQYKSGDEFEINFLSPNEFDLVSMEGKRTRYLRPAPYAPTAEELKAFAGNYDNNETGAAFEITPGKEGVMVRVNWNDSRAFEFKPIARDTFQLGYMILRFQRNKDGKITGFDYSNPAVRNIKFTRLGDDCR